MIEPFHGNPTLSNMEEHHKEESAHALPFVCFYIAFQTEVVSDWILSSQPVLFSFQHYYQNDQCILN